MNFAEKMKKELIEKGFPVTNKPKPESKQMTVRTEKRTRQSKTFGSW
jgi:hypothetical protein